jgi:predicted DNA-binding ribbon-helix-helix protein
MNWHTLSLRLTKDQIAHIKKLAGEKNMKIAELIRRLIEKAK